MKQPFRTVAELPLINVPKKEPFDWFKLFIGMMPVFVIGMLALVIWSGVHDAKVQNKEIERTNQENAKIRQEAALDLNARTSKCIEWKAIDKESCATCLSVSSIADDKRCADVNRWNIKDSK